MRPPLSPRPSWSSSDDQTVFNLIVILIGAGVGGYLLWTNFHAQISVTVMAVRHQEMLLLSHFTGKFEQADDQMAHANPYRVTLRDLYGISRAIGQFWRIPACIFIVLLAALCMARAAPSRFKRAFDLDGLIREQVKTFRSVAAFVGRKLRLVLPAEGDPRPADYSLTAEEWLQRYAIDAHGQFDENRVRAALVRQLGPRWSSPETASPVAKLLFIAFALHLSERRDDAVEILGVMSAALASEDARLPDGPGRSLIIPTELLTRVSALIADPEAFSEARKIAAEHAYTTPALMTLLNAARVRHGVLAPAQFAWVKLIDRPLWYGLHSLGFETEGVGLYLHPNPRVEALGARDHWAVERAAGVPLVEPDVSRALAALRGHLTSRAHAFPFERKSPSHASETPDAPSA